MAGIFRMIGGIAERLVHATSTEATTTAAKLGAAAAHVRAPVDRVAHELPRASELSVARDRAAAAIRTTPERTPHGRTSAGSDIHAARLRETTTGAHGGPSVSKMTSIIKHHVSGQGQTLITTPELSAKIARGEHQISEVQGRHIDYPSQDIRLIESTSPKVHGQTHIAAKHLGTDLAANIKRLVAEPHIRAAGSFTDESSAQFAIDVTIANAANQRLIEAFLNDASNSKTILKRVDLGRTVGSSTTRADLDAGKPTLYPARTANVVIIKDDSFPEGYRILTSYPVVEAKAQVDALGNPLRGSK